MAYSPTVYPHERLVYQITHKASGRAYIGQTTQGAFRWSTHFADAFLKERNAAAHDDELHTLLRTDMTAFTFEVLQHCIDEDEQKDREKFWVAKRLHEGVSLFNKLLTVRYGYGPHGQDNPYIGSFPPPAKKRKPRKQPLATIDSMTPAIWKLMNEQGVPLTRIAEAYGVSVALVHLHIGEHRKVRSSEQSSTAGIGSAWADIATNEKEES